MPASRICATTGADSRRAAIRPSTVSRLCRLSVARMANSNSGRRLEIRSRTAESPLDWRSSQGSAPVGSTATKVCATKRWSSSKARSAAFWPAASPSKVKMTSPPLPSSDSSRRAILM